MDTVLSYMGDDHDRLDRIFAEYQKQKNYPEASKNLFHEFLTGLYRHISIGRRRFYFRCSRKRPECSSDHVHIVKVLSSKKI